MSGPDDRKESAMTTAHPTGALEGVPPEELAEYYALWDRLRAEAISESDRHEIDAVFARAS
jgi:hypothetical protein